jgi:hypothetical protein
MNISIIEHDVVGESKSRFVKRTIIAGLVFFIGFIVFVLMIPTILMISMGPGPSVFLYQTEFQHNSPDGRFRLDVERRMNFPADDLLSPSGTIRVTLIDVSSAKPIDQRVVWIHEHPELQDPVLMWTPETVLVTNIETHNLERFELSTSRATAE